MTQLPNDSGTSPQAPRLPISQSKLFYGWIIVGVGFVNQVAQGLVNQGFSAYADVLSAEFGWSKAALAGPRSITSVQNSMLGPLTGFLVDRFGPRIVVGAGMSITGLGLVLLGITNAMWVYYVANILMALGLSVGGMLVMSVAVNNWFRRRATLAQSMMLLGFSLAGVFGVPLLVFLQSALGWRHSATWTGIAIIVIAVPCSFLLRQRPETFGLLPDGDSPGTHAQANGGPPLVTEHNFTLGQAVRTRAFWLLAFGWSVISLGTGVVQVHLFLHLGQGSGGVGLERTTVALVWSVASISNIPARLLGGFLGDRLPKNLTLGMAGLFMAGSVFALALATSFTTALFFAVPYGIGWGMSTPVMNSAQGEYFGRRSLGAIRGSLQLAALPFTIAAPVVVGHMADTQGTYRWAFIMISTVMVLGAGLVFLAKRPTAPYKDTVRPA